MDVMLLFARVIHVSAGVFWAGTLVFNAVFLLPSIRDAGPEGAKVGAALMKRGFMTVMPVVALLAILSGLWLYWKASNGFAAGYGGTGPGMAYGTGALTAIIAFVVGISMIRPSMLKAAALSQGAASLAGAEKEAAMATAAGLRVRAAKGGQWVATLLTVTVLAMALGRYL